MDTHETVLARLEDRWDRAHVEGFAMRHRIEGETLGAVVSVVLAMTNSAIDRGPLSLRMESDGVVGVSLDQRRVPTGRRGVATGRGLPTVMALVENLHYTTSATVGGPTIDRASPAAAEAIRLRDADARRAQALRLARHHGIADTSPDDPVAISLTQPKRQRDETHDWGRERRLGTDFLEELVLVVSELVTNAVLHGGGLVQVSLAKDGDEVTVEVEQRTVPRRRTRSSTTVGGGFDHAAALTFTATARLRAYR